MDRRTMACWSKLVLSPPVLPNSNSGKPGLEIEEGESIYIAEMANYAYYTHFILPTRKLLAAYLVAHFWI